MEFMLYQLTNVHSLPPPPPHTPLGDDNDKLSVLPPSTTGSLSSITTTSLVSEPGGGSDGAGSDRGDDKGDEKRLAGIKHEKWWETTIQVAIPFFIAGIGTIGAGIILGRVEVSFYDAFDSFIHRDSSKTS